MAIFNSYVKLPEGTYIYILYIYIDLYPRSFVPPLHVDGRQRDGPKVQRGRKPVRNGRRMSTAATNDVVVNAMSTRCSWEKTHPQSERPKLRLTKTCQVSTK